MNSFEYHFKRGTFAEGAELLLVRALGGLTKKPQKALNCFLDGLSLLIIDRDWRKLGRVLDEHETNFAGVSNYGKFAVKRLRAEYLYIGGFYHEAYDVIRWILHELPVESKSKEVMAVLKKDFFGMKLHHLAGKIRSRSGDNAVARVHLGFALSFGMRDLRVKKIKYHYLIGRVMLSYMRTHLDGRQYTYCKRILKNVRRQFDGYFGKAEKPEEQHLYYVDLIYLEGRLISKRRKLGWIKKVEIKAEIIQAIVKNYGTKGAHRRIERYHFLLGYANLKKVESEIKSKYKGQVQHTHRKKLRIAYDHFDELLKLQRKAGDKGTSALEARTLNFMMQTLRHECSFWKYRDHDTRFDQEYNRCYQLGERARQVNRGIDVKGIPVVPNFNDYADLRQAYKTAAGCLELYLMSYLFISQQSIPSAGELAKIYLSVSTCFDTTYKLLRANFIHATTPGARESFYFSFRKVQEAMLEVLFLEKERLESIGEDFMPIIEQTAQVIARGDKQDWAHRNAGRDVGLDKKRNKDDQHLKHMRIMEKAYFRMFRDGAAKLRKRKTVSDYHRYNNYAWDLMKDHLNKLSRTSTSNLYATGGEAMGRVVEVTLDRVYNAFHLNDHVAIYSIFVGQRHIYGLCLVKNSKGEHSSNLIRLTDVEVEDRRQIMQDVQDFHDVSKKIVRRKMKNPDDWSALDSDAVSWDSHSKVELLNVDLVEYSRFIYQRLIKKLNIPSEIDRLYFNFSNHKLQRLCLPAVCLPSKSEDMLDEAEPYGSTKFSEIKWLGVMYSLATVNSLVDFFYLDRESIMEKGDIKSGETAALLARFVTNNCANQSEMDELARKMKAISLRVEHELNESLGGTLGRPVKKWIEVVPTGKKYQQNDKRKLLKKIQKTRSFFMFTHTDREGGAYKRRYKRDHRLPKLMLQYKQLSKSKKKQKKEYAPWNYSHKRSNYSIYYDDVNGLNCNSLYFSFLATCKSVAGKARQGDIPHSMLASFMEAGCHSAIGTRYAVQDAILQRFVTSLVEEWIAKPNIQKQRNPLSLGIAVRKVMQKMNKDGLHPLTWSVFSLMGNQSLIAEKIFGIPNE